MIDSNDLSQIRNLVRQEIEKHTHKGIGSIRIPIHDLANLTLSSNKIIIYNPMNKSYLYISATT